MPALDRDSTVFLLDQDSELRNAVIEATTELGVEFRACRTSEELHTSLSDHPSAPRCLVLDLDLPRRGALRLEMEIRSRNDNIPIVGVSGLADGPTVVQVLQGGVLSVLAKPVTANQLSPILQQALVLDQERMIDTRKSAHYQAGRVLLSSREREVMELIVGGKNSKEIGAILGIGVQTVLKHRAQVLRKINVRNDVELALLVAASQSRQYAGIGTAPMLSMDDLNLQDDTGDESQIA
jgi:FixJ family two-component response regulator